MKTRHISETPSFLNSYGWILFVLTLITLISSVIFFYRSQEKAIQERVEKNLTAIARLKADQISDWRRDNLKDAGLFSAFLRLSVPRFLADPNEENRRDNLFRFQSLADQHDYDDIILVSLDGKELLSLSGTLDVHKEYLSVLETVLNERKPVFLDLHKESKYLSIHSSIVAPLFAGEGPDAELIGALVLVIDATKFLYPLIQSWPTTENTAETLLVRLDNDQVLFLNALRYQPDAALNLRIPLTRTDSAAVMAVQGKEGYVETKDYREMDVSGVILPIPESPWYIIAKIDRKEAFSEWHFRSLLLFFLILGLALLLGAVGLVFRQREKKIEFQKLYQSESALRQTLESHSATLKAIGDAVISTDAGGLVTLMNPVAESLTGQKQDETRGKPLEEIFCIINAETREKVVNPVEMVLKDGLSMGLANPTILISKDGKEYRISDSAAPIKDSDGRLIGVVLVFRDISHEIEMEEKLSQAQKMESIGTLAGGIAHDFNNILFSIVGHTEMLMDDLSEESSSIRDSLNQIYSSSLRARDLVQQILAFARQEKNELKLMKMQPIIKEAIKLIRSTIPTTISITQNLQPDCRPVSADPTQIHQIVMNLATNAYHAMEESGGELKVNLKEIELGEDDLINPDMSPGLYACLTIGDTGEGMNKDVMNRIFDPFFTTKEKGKGTGMGLSVVHGIVKQMNGDVQVYSEPGKGTEFHIYLPIVKTDFETQETQANLLIIGGTESILLIDDEGPILRMEKQAIERLGYHVTSQISSIEALEAFRANPDKFDLVITDMAMPKMSGDKLANELIKIRPDIPVLLCTGFSESMTDEKIKSLGIKGFLKKPIVIKDLAQKIREVLDEAKG